VRGFDKIEDVSIVRVVAKPASRDVKRVSVEMRPGFTKYRRNRSPLAGRRGGAGRRRGQGPARPWAAPV